MQFVVFCVPEVTVHSAHRGMEVKLTHTLEQLLGTASGFLGGVAEIMENSIGKSSSDLTNRILKYPLSPRGHLIRPFLVYTAARSLNNGELTGDTLNKMLYFAAAVELLHNASLVHDDVLDKEASRRGKECLYRVYGDTNAILTGNVYYITAFEVALENLGKEQFRGLVAAAAEMCYGEMLQKEFEGSVKPRDVYFEIIRKKTSTLMGIACQEAARLAGGGDARIKDLRRLGELIGSIYQLQDDFKDDDAGLEAEFDYVSSALSLMEQAEEIVNGLPNLECAKIFEELMLILKNCIRNERITV